jgi:ACT domain-containing protein
MASRELKVVISKKSETQIKKAIDKIDESGAAVKGLKLGKKTVNGMSVSVLKILVEV